MQAPLRELSTTGVHERESGGAERKRDEETKVREIGEMRNEEGDISVVELGEPSRQA